MTTGFERLQKEAKEQINERAFAKIKGNT